MRFLAPLVALALLALPLQAADPILEDRLGGYLNEPDPAERMRLGLQIAASETDVGVVAAALPDAWSWDADAPRGEVVTWTRESADGVSHTIYAFAPEDYTPDKAWDLLLWLHGGVGRDQDGGGESGVEMFAREASDKGFLVLSPSTQNGAFWWEPNGMALLRGALADMKRRYRIDANRVCVAGFSDGASGCYHLACYDPGPYACFLAFMGYPLVSRTLGGPTWPANLGARPMYAVNGGTDPLYPSERVRPLVEEMKAKGLDVTWIDEAEIGHSLAFLENRWEEAYEFWRTHARLEHPHELSWCTSRPEDAGRFEWLEITGVGAGAPLAKGLDAPEELASPDDRRPRLGIRIDTEFEGPGLLIEDVEEGTPAADAGLQVGDVILEAGEDEVESFAEIEILREYLESLARGEEDGVFRVKRGDDEMEIRVRPRILEKDKPPRPVTLGYDVPAGVARAKLRDGGVFEVETAGVTSLRLWLDLALVPYGSAVTVRVNGKQVFQGPPPWSVPVLLGQAVAGGPGAPLYAGTLDVEVPK